jgi:predicted RNase H-like nuclease (RuvC/YqgF family)
MYYENHIARNNVVLIVHMWPRVCILTDEIKPCFNDANFGEERRSMSDVNCDRCRELRSRLDSEEKDNLKLLNENVTLNAQISELRDGYKRQLLEQKQDFEQREMEMKKEYERRIANLEKKSYDDFKTITNLRNNVKRLRNEKW